MMSYTFISADLVMPAFVQTLTTSSILVGMAGALMRMGWAWPQCFISRIIEPKPRKMPLLIGAGLARSAMWILVGAMTLFLGGMKPAIFLFFFMVFLRDGHIADGRDERAVDGSDGQGDSRVSSVKNFRAAPIFRGRDVHGCRAFDFLYFERAKRAVISE